MKKPYKIIQDDDSHWYWIPTNLLEEFKAYVDNRENDSDIDRDQYRTYWSKDITPEFWKDGKEKRTYWESEVTCPHCGYEHMDSFERPDDWEEECFVCNKKFSYERVIDVTYRTRWI